MGLHQTYNHDIWPLQILISISTFLAIGLLFFRFKFSDQIFSALLAAIWFWIGLVYHRLYFASINWAAFYFSWLFIFESALFLILGVVGRKLSFEFSKGVSSLIGTGLFLYSFLGPLQMTLIFDREGRGIQLFGWGADATALGTLGLVLLLQGRFVWVLLFLAPLLWCALALTMHYGLKAVDFYWLAAAFLMAVLGAVVKATKPRLESSQKF